VAWMSCQATPFPAKPRLAGSKGRGWRFEVVSLAFVQESSCDNNIQKLINRKQILQEIFCGSAAHRQARLGGDAIALALIALVQQHVLHQLHRPLLADHQLRRVAAVRGLNASAACNIAKPT